MSDEPLPPIHISCGWRTVRIFKPPITTSSALWCNRCRRYINPMREADYKRPPQGIQLKREVKL